MTHPIPTKALEAAARALFNRRMDVCLPFDGLGPRSEYAATMKANAIADAKAALTAALENGLCEHEGEAKG